ncbi:uncharacterized protein isoform X2 [Musca autumnalis]
MDEVSIKPPQRKYVSIFRIDGEPIIPPLMTSEKIRQMQKYKEKAMKIEQRLKEQKLQQNSGNNGNAEGLAESPRSSIAITTPSEGLSFRSQDLYDNRLKESEESMLILKDIIRRQSAGCDEGVGKYDYEKENDDKLKKLQKSETLIYDNSKNEVIKQVPGYNDDENIFINHSIRSPERDVKELSEKQNETYTIPKKPHYLELSGGFNDSVKSIPSICINPPTPLMVNRPICEPSFLGNNKSDGFFVTETKHIRQHLADDSSSDESFNSMYTHSEKKVPPPVPERTYKLPRSSKMHDLKSFNTATTNVTAKIQQYEAISSEQSTPRVTPNSSPRRNVHETANTGTPSTGKKNTYEISIQGTPRSTAKKNTHEMFNQGTPSTTKKNISEISKQATPTSSIIRSATSPSLKLASSVDPRPLTTLDCSQISADTTLVRSSSFTLEGPSKALIDHMRQQRSVSDRNPTNGTKKIVSPPAVTKKVSPPSRLHRDTVESKAKRVQKVELKPSRQKVQQKSSQHKMAQAAAASISPYKSKSSPFPKHGSTIHLYKTKKSPYDSPNSTRISPSTPTTVKTSCQTRKSPPSSSASSSASSQRTASNKSRSSRASIQPQSQQSNQKPNTTTTTKATSPEKEVLTQMDKMQREKFLRLLRQQEEEQRKLKESFEMQQKLLIEQLNKEMSGIQVTPITPKQKTPININETSSRISPDNTQQSLNVTHDDSSILPSNINCDKYTSVYPQVPPLAISNLSSLDHSNANTSMESSSARYGGGIDQSTFRTDSVADDDDLLTPIENRYTTTISPGNNHHLKESSEQEQHTTPVKGYTVASTTTINSKREIHQMNVLHAAATTINAYARGFLVRRLFKTEQIQRIVQTIHDTLIFVLNLHLETCENPSEANNPTNIKLKARLLQQLSSATQTLHVVLFQTTIKERMEIIAQDRKRMKHKLLMTISRNSSSRKTPRIPV